MVRNKKKINKKVAEIILFLFFFELSTILIAIIIFFSDPTVVVVKVHYLWKKEKQLVHLIVHTPNIIIVIHMLILIGPIVTAMKNQNN